HHELALLGLIVGDGCLRRRDRDVQIVDTGVGGKHTCPSDASEEPSVGCHWGVLCLVCARGKGAPTREKRARVVMPSTRGLWEFASVSLHSSRRVAPLTTLGFARLRTFMQRLPRTRAPPAPSRRVSPSSRPFRT